MYLLITDEGLQGTRAAEQGGFKLNITEFAVSEEQNVSLTVGDKEMQGPAVYRAGIESIEAIGISTVKFTLTIPSSKPAAGEWMLGEIAVYLDNGTMFAHGALPTVMQKTSEFGIKFYVYVTEGRLGEIINVTISSITSISSVPHVRSLLAPNISQQNVVAVLDEAVDGLGVSSAGLAVKYGTGSLSWAFVGYRHQIEDYPSSIFSQGQFVYEVETKGGFWLNDTETVIVQVIKGPGQGESRKMTFNKTANTFTVVDRNFSALSSASKVAIWRDNSVQLPARESNLPEYLVLGVGKNTWQPNVVALTAGTLYPYRSSHLVVGNSVATGADIPLSAFNDTTKFLVFVDGVLLEPNQYTAVTGTIMTTVSAATSIDVLAFEFIQDQGSSIYFYEAAYDGDGITSAFQLPIIPDSVDSVLVFDGSRLVPVDDYVLNGSQIIFNAYAPTNKVVLVPFATYAELGVRSSFVRDSFVSTGTDVDFTTSSIFGLRKDTLMTVNGLYVLKDNYTVNANRVILANNFSIPVGSIVDIINFNGQAVVVEIQPEGVNTGPVWIDPAGVVGAPNLLVPQVFTYHGDGVRTTFDIADVPDENYLFVFIKGVFQPPSSFYYSSLAIRFEQPLRAGYPIDIICWKSEPNTGTQVVGKYTSLSMAQAQLQYAVHNVSNVDSAVVSINGVYQHKETYVFNSSSSITFGESIEGDVLEVWSFDWIPKLGFMTSINIEQQGLSTNTSYILNNPVAATADTLLFAGGAQVHKANRYSVDVGAGLSTIQLTNSPYAYQQGMPLFIVEFFSEKPRSRLMTRAEIEAYYMPLRGPHVSWDNLTDGLKSILACPILKLLGLLTGTIKAELNNPNLLASDRSVAAKWGFVPVTMNVEEDIIPILNYAAIGSSVMLDLPVSFNFFDLLTAYIRTELGTSDFSIMNYEAGRKYVIDNIDVSNVSFSAKSQVDIPGAPLDTAWVLGAFGGTVYTNTTHMNKDGGFGAIVMLSTDGEWWTNIVGIMGSPVGNPGLATVSVTSYDDATYRYFTHVISQGGALYTVKIARQLIITDHNAQFLVAVDNGGAPLVVQLFARIYASLKYNDADINTVIYCMNRPITVWGVGTPCCEAYMWVKFSYDCRAGLVGGVIQGGAYGSIGGQYPAVAAYTAGLAYGVSVYDTNTTTGDAKVVVYLTSGSIGYSQFGVDLMLNAVKLPVTYTVYPGMHVNPDGSIEPVMSSNDIFDSCCWTGIDATLSPSCASETPALPRDQTLAPTVQISPSTLSTTDHLYITVSNVKPGAAISWESSDTPNQVNAVGNADNSGYFSYTSIPAGSPRALTFKVFVDGGFLSTVGVTVLNTSGAQADHGSVEFVTDGTFTVPNNIYSLQVEELAAGGGGAGGDHAYGGLGGEKGQYVLSTVAVTPGEVLSVIIGKGGVPGLGCITNPTSANDGTSGSNTVLKHEDGTEALVASGGLGGRAAGHFGTGTKGQSSQMGIGGPGGNVGLPTYDAITGKLINYLTPGSGSNAGGYAAGGGGGGASARDIADAIAGASGGIGTKGWMRITY